MGSYCLFPRTPGLFSSLNVQKNMLQDSLRNDAFRRAVFAAVNPGDTVIDLGTGTGILAMWAAEAGANKVYAVEETDVACAAEEVIRANGYGDRICVVRSNSGELKLHEQADVLIAELVGHFLFEEGIVEYIADVRGRLIKPGGRIIPRAARVFVAPVELPKGFQELSYWETWKSPDLAAIRKIAANSAYVETVEPASVLGAPALLFEIDFHQESTKTRVAEANFEITRRGQVGAIAGWFRLTLGDGIALPTGPWDPRTHWQQCVFPLENPLTMEAGESLACRFTIQPFAEATRWVWEICSPSRSFKERHEIQVLSGSRQLYERF